MNKVSIIGIDLAKNVFQLYGADVDGKQCFSRQLRRSKLLGFLARQPRCMVAMEACGGAHYWAREVAALGHEVKMMHPRYVKPFVQVHKNDQRDAQAIAEAAARQNIPAVPPKSLDQQDLQAVHRVRERLVKERTAIGNELRGLLMEYGQVIAQGNRAVKTALPRLLEDASNGLTPIIRRLLHDLRAQWLARDEEVASLTRELASLSRDNDVCRRLQSIPGIGPINATLLYCHAGDVNRFRSGRQFGAYLGLVPRQHASGGKERLLGISKAGNVHVRKQLVHGARAAYKQLLNAHQPSRLGEWVQGKTGKHPNKVIVGLANKLARIIWSLMARGGVYQP